MRMWLEIQLNWIWVDPFQHELHEQILSLSSIIWDTTRFRKKNLKVSVVYVMRFMSCHDGLERRTNFQFWFVHTDSLLLIHHVYIGSRWRNNSSLNTVAWRTASMRPVFTNHGPVSFKDETKTLPVYLARNPCYKKLTLGHFKIV